MKLTWYGHSCFLMETEGGSIVFDPYAPGSVPGLELPPLAADMTVCSHEHRDHFYPQGVTLTGLDPVIGMQRMLTFHDDEGGAKRGDNIITLVDADGVRALHLGDLGHMLSDAQNRNLGRVDVLMIPVGGYFTIDAEQAWALVEKLDPFVVIPMHYRGEGFGYDVIDTVDRFLGLAKRVRFFEGSVLDLSAVTEPMTAVLRCPVKRLGKKG